jgi:hypothetical protein
LIHLLTNVKSLNFLDSKNPLSPSAEIKCKQWLKMSPEKKNAQREKSRIMMKTKRDLNSEMQTATVRAKTGLR